MNIRETIRNKVGARVDADLGDRIGDVTFLRVRTEFLGNPIWVEVENGIRFWVEFRPRIVAEVNQ